MHDFVQEDGEIEHGETLDERQRNPDERVRDRDETPRRETEDRKLTRGNQQMARRSLRVKRAQRITRDRAAELRMKRSRMLTVIV